MKAFLFPSPVILEVVGKDAERYLQARLTNDIRKLAENSSFLAACLTPQGKTEAVFEVFRVAADRFLLISLGGDSEEVVSALLRFKVADQLECKDLSTNYRLLFVDQTSSHLAVEALFKISSNYFRKDLMGEFYLCKEDSLQEVLDQVTLMPATEFFARRVINDSPVFPDEILPDSLFMSAKLMQAISFDKGCYAGQEVVERVDALGKLPAQLQAYILDQEIISLNGQSIVNEQEQKVGQVIRSEIFEGKTYLFASVKTKALEQEKFIQHDQKIFL